MEKRDLIYLDNAATSFPKPYAVSEAVKKYMLYCGGNPSRGFYATALEAAEKVFSTEYLDKIYESAFDGIVTDASTYMRFYELEGKIYQSISANDFGLSERIYDYSTMTVVKPSNNEYINVTVETYTLDDDTRVEITLSFAFERGDWYLDCPTY